MARGLAQQIKMLREKYSNSSSPSLLRMVLRERLASFWGDDEPAKAAVRERLAPLSGDVWDQALADAVAQRQLARRVPPPGELGTLLHGMVAFGEGGRGGLKNGLQCSS